MSTDSRKLTSTESMLLTHALDSLEKVFRSIFENQENDNLQALSGILSVLSYVCTSPIASIMASLDLDKDQTLEIFRYLGDYTIELIYGKGDKHEH